MLATHKLTKGTGGNISALDREKMLFAISPSGMDYFAMQPEDVVVLETSPGQRSRWDRRAVARILDPSGVPEPEGSVPGGPGPADGQTENRSPASPRSGDARSGGTIPGGAEAPQDEPPSSATPPPGN